MIELWNLLALHAALGVSQPEGTCSYRLCLPDAVLHLIDGVVGDAVAAYLLRRVYRTRMIERWSLLFLARDVASQFVRE